MGANTFISSDIKAYVDSLPNQFDGSHFPDSLRYSVMLLTTRLKNNLALKGSSHRLMSEYYQTVIAEIIEMRDTIRTLIVRHYDTIVFNGILFSTMYRELDLIDIDSLDGAVSYLTELLGVLHYIILNVSTKHIQVYTAIFYSVVDALNCISIDNGGEEIKNISYKWR